MSALGPRTMASSRYAVRSSAFAAVRQFHSTPSRLVVHHAPNEKTFRNHIEQNDKVIVDCFADWCGPCKAISPILEKLSETDEFKEIHFVKFDVDELPALSQELGVRAMPTFFFFKNGNKVDEMVGANPGGLQTKLKLLSRN
ncbi:unnamed protein product [Clonostachys rosea]|uniref:Thioredoxin domain-containing protein n=1 Tax=Bionectria ochroleuca TaxID=29856 RepID=A0ABY6URZ2_BIOOC|nr:unnamed protein product [Clonostachys rosea]